MKNNKNKNVFLCFPPLILFDDVAQIVKDMDLASVTSAVGVYTRDRYEGVDFSRFSTTGEGINNPPFGTAFHIEHGDGNGMPETPLIFNP